MRKYLGSIGAFYLGFSLAYFLEVSYLMWEFYVVTIPTLILFSLDKNLNKNKR
jgi:hypothetical protein